MAASLFHTSLIKDDRSLEQYCNEIIQSEYVSNSIVYISDALSSLLSAIISASTRATKGEDDQNENWVEITHADADIKADIRKDIAKISVGHPETYDQTYPIYARIMELPRTDYLELTAVLVAHVCAKRS